MMQESEKVKWTALQSHTVNLPPSTIPAGNKGYPKYIFLLVCKLDRDVCCVYAAFFHSPCVSWVGQTVLKMSLVSAGVSSSYKAAFWVSFKNVGSNLSPSLCLTLQQLTIL